MTDKSIGIYDKNSIGIYDINGVNLNPFNNAPYSDQYKLLSKFLFFLISSMYKPFILRTAIAFKFGCSSYLSQFFFKYSKAPFTSS